MSLYGDDYLTDPGYKAYVRGVGGGGRGPTGGGSGGVGGLAGGGAGGLLGGLNTTTGGNESALKTLLRKRMRMPGGAASPSYANPATPAAEGGSRFGVNFGGTGMVMQPTVVGRGGRPTPQPTPTPTGGNLGATPPGTWIPPSVNPNNDPTFEYTPWSGAGADQSRELNQVYMLLNQFAQNGAFSGGGSSGLMDMQRSGALADANALRSRNRLAAQSMGTDPATAASYALQSDLNTQGNASDAVSKAALEQLLNQQQFGQSLLGAVTGANFADWNARRDGQWNRDNGVYSGGGGSGWGDFLGQAAGAAVGGAIGGPWGASFGAGIGKRAAGGR